MTAIAKPKLDTPKTPMSKIEPSFIDDIFGIPRDGSNIQDDETDTYPGTDGDKEKGAKIPFTEKVADLSKEIKLAVSAANNLIENPMEKAVIKKESASQSSKKDDIETAIKSAIPSDPKSPNLMFGDIFATTVTVEKEEPKASPKPTVPRLEDAVRLEAKTLVKAESETETRHESASIDQVKTDSTQQSQILPSKKSEPLNIADKQHIRWKLSSPSPKFDYFYSQKRESLEDDLLVGGELDFDKSFKELEDSHVDVTVGETFQAELVAKQIQQVQKWRDRVKLVQLRVNRQYFIWARVMDLFGGLLARIEDVRGVEKREGIKHEHMYDMHVYFGLLESLHKSVTAVMANLDGAFECLSRQVTITMPMKDADRYSTGPKPLTPQLQRFDGLKTQSNGSGSIPASRSKEAGEPAESQTKSGWGIVG